jgi:arylformamidase
MDTSERNHDPAWLDRQYNNRARVPEHPQLLAQWARESARVRFELPMRLDVRYGEEPFERLDVFPTHRDRAPVLVFIHGGWWRSLDKCDHSFVAEHFVREGAMVVVPNYALAPAVTIDQIALQMVQALAWVWRHAALYGGDPRRIVVAGHSAGAHLAAMLLCCSWRSVARDLPEDLVGAALGVSGVYDLEPLRHTPFLREDLQLSAHSVKRMSPARFPAPRGIFHAAVGALESEEFVRQNALIRQAWGPRTVQICEAVPGANHFDVLHDLAQPEGRLHGLAWALMQP